MKYKQVHVYTAYNENSIQSIDVFEYPGDVRCAGEFVEHNILTALEADIPDDVSDEQRDAMLDHHDEFHTGVEVVDGVAVIPHGEEMVVLVIPCNNHWFDRVNVDQSTWDEATCNAWEAFVWCDIAEVE